ncbi:DNA polymerase alpha catalytic subunit, partial [Vararia minispora EC-137]
RSDRQSRSSALEELKRARAGGKRDWKVEDATLYDEITEDEYKRVVAGRLQKDDFVIDDGVDGYMDNGMDDWGQGEASEEDEDRTSRRGKSMKQATGSKAKVKPTAPPPVPPSISAYRPTKTAEQEEEFMTSLFQGMDNMPIPATSSRARKRKPSPVLSYSQDTYRDPFNDLSSDGPPSDGFDLAGDASSDGDFYMSPKKKTRREAHDVGPTTARLNGIHMNCAKDEGDEYDAAFRDDDLDGFMDVDDPEPKPTHAPKPAASAKHAPATRPLKKEDNGPPAWLAVYDSLAVASDESFGSLGTNGGAPSSSTASAARIKALQPDGAFHFFWMDYLEHEGVLYFIGKTRDQVTGTFVSCCVTVNNLERNLFVLPRSAQLDEDGNETDVVPGLPDVFQDFDAVRQMAGIKKWKGKFVKRKYAFGEADVPKEETQWLKAVYSFNEPVIPMNVSSPNFSRVFGTNTSAFELLVLKRKIMGPCWIKIKRPHVEHKGVSWCQLEVTVDDPKDFNPFPETDDKAPKETPPLTIASLSVRTVVNHQENNREIVCVSARIWYKVNIDDPTPPESLPCTVHTYVRPLGEYPGNFETFVKSNKKGLISPMKNERMLLAHMLNTLYKADPDVIVGHEFLGVSLDVLLHRMRSLKVEHWSRLGRFRRAKWPNIGRQGSNMRFLNGRLLCDLASDGAKSMIASTTWSLTEMCRTHLKNEREDIDPEDTASYFDGSVSSPERLTMFVRHCELDAHYQMAIASKVQVLPLTKQLTNLAGNSWNKTLNGGRAERNEYILLHEFHRLKYICPDKQWGKKAAVVKADPDDDAEGGTVIKTGKGRRDKYKGGLVFEPKRGLWDKYILVMDFNSLYPSIIQEYNIDFTTVDRVEDEDGEERIPEPPAKGVPQGVLPRLIATLVKRRKAVKNLMKDRTLDPSGARYLQYNIKQQALKLTANSMYGCLGFENSRFYARPLAALTTFKGREILTHTRELAESLQLDVVYGDTDSIFVNSNVTELSDAMKISNELKKAVNDRYKLLEIDLDGVFQRLLLLQKKKYAAIKVEEGGTRTSTEVKGLDMKRREYCALSKAVSQYVLEQILSGEATETVVENIHDYLTTIGVDVRAGRVKLDEFIIFKRLGKAPEDYPDAKSQPHVQVALKMKARGGSARAGDVIPYIFCLSEGTETGKVAQAERARHPDELRKSTEAKIDFEYYLANQILPPIERLCDPIEGTDRARLAECLGLDPGRYRTSVMGDGDEHHYGTFDSRIPESERYKDAAPFVVRCRHCESNMAFLHMSDEQARIAFASGPACLACHRSISGPSLVAQLECQIREHISRYYQGWTVCDEQTCKNRTRAMRVYGRRCLKPDCRGRVRFEYNDVMLYDQLRYFAYLFDPTKAGTSREPTFSLPRGYLKRWFLAEFTEGLVLNQADLLQRLSQTVEKYLDMSGRRWVDMDSLFSFMNL